MERIGFLGLGIMGSGMVENLVKGGYSVTVWNRTRSKAEAISGVTIADTPRAAAEGNDIVFTMLADPMALEEVVYGDDGLLAGLQAGSILIDSSTVNPMVSCRLAENAATRGARFLDCPVTGSKQAVADGQLVFMVGGDSAVLECVRPILEKLGKKIVHAGGNGMGTTLKLCFNMLIGHMGAALSESLILGTKAGLDPQIILETIGSGIAASPLYDWKGNCILDRDFTTNFSLKLLHKDLEMISETGYAMDVPLPTTAAVKELFSMAKAACDPEADYVSVIKILESAVGLEVKRKS